MGDCHGLDGWLSGRRRKACRHAATGQKTAGDRNAVVRTSMRSGRSRTSCDRLKRSEVLLRQTQQRSLVDGLPERLLPAVNRPVSAARQRRQRPIHAHSMAGSFGNAPFNANEADSWFIAGTLWGSSSSPAHCQGKMASDTRHGDRGGKRHCAGVESAFCLDITPTGSGFAAPEDNGGVLTSTIRTPPRRWSFPRRRARARSSV